MVNIIDILLQAKQFNGHFQTEITKISHSDAMGIVRSLEERFLNKSCELREYSDGGGSIYILDYWAPGENDHHKDRLVVSFDEITHGDDKESNSTQIDPECICHINLRSLVKESHGLHNKRFTENETGRVLIFHGLTITDDDYYYDFICENGKHEYFSCVGNFETWGLTRCEDKT